MNQLAGHLIVECLIAQGTTRVYGVPGESYLAVLDGLHAQADRIQFITCRQEGGAAYMAEAEGKLSGRPGVLFVTRGPGATNATVGIHTAYQDSTPLVVFIGDVASDARDREAFQEVDFRAFLGPNTLGLAKRVERIDDARRIPEYVARAFATAMNGRPGPVVLVLPEDMLTQTVTATPLPRVHPVQYQNDAESAHMLIQMLSKAQRPLVIAGGPGWTPEAARALQRFAERWHLPVANAFRFQDMFDNHHRLYAGDVGIGINPRLAERIKASDLLLVVGPRLGEMTTGSYTLVEPPRPRQSLVHIHPDPQELNRVYQADLALCASMPGAAAMLDGLPPPATTPWRDGADAAHADYLASLQPQALPGPIDLAAIVKTAQRLLPPDAVVTTGAGNFSGWVQRFWRFHGLAHGQRSQLAPTNGSMGYGVPAGIAAALATGRTVFTMTGDGDFLMNGQELATAVAHGAKTIVVLLNNASYGTIRMHQEREFPTRVVGSRLVNPDFAALARAYGYAGERITTTEAFEPALRAALQRSQGTLLELMVDVDVITTRTTLSAIRTHALAQAMAKS